MHAHRSDPRAKRTGGRKASARFPWPHVAVAYGAAAPAAHSLANAQRKCVTAALVVAVSWEFSGKDINVDVPMPVGPHLCGIIYIYPSIYLSIYLAIYLSSYLAI